MVSAWRRLQQALASVSVQGRPLLSLVSAAPLLLQPFRQIDTIGRQAPSIEHNAQLFAAATAPVRASQRTARRHASGRMVLLRAGSDASDQLADGHRKHVQLLLT